MLIDKNVAQVSKLARPLTREEYEKARARLVKAGMLDVRKWVDG